MNPTSPDGTLKTAAHTVYAWGRAVVCHEGQRAEPRSAETQALPQPQPTSRRKRNGAGGERHSGILHTGPRRLALGTQSTLHRAPVTNGLHSREGWSTLGAGASWPLEDQYPVLVPLRANTEATV